MAPVATRMLSRQARNLNSGVRMRNLSCAPRRARLARPITSAVNIIHRERLLGRHHQFQELAAHQRHLDDAPAERRRVARHPQRLVEAAAHHGGGAHPVGEPRQVDLVEHLLEAVAQIADLPCHRALEADLAARHRAGAELVLQAHDPVAVAPAVLEPPRQGEQREAGGSRARALRPREQQRHVGVGMRAEPFVAVEPPLAVFVARHGLDRADVGAAGLLGHELRALPLDRRVRRQHARQQPRLELVAAVADDEVDGGVGDADRAHQAELALHEEILEARTWRPAAAGAASPSTPPRWLMACNSKSPKAIASISR